MEVSPQQSGLAVSRWGLPWWRTGQPLSRPLSPRPAPRESLSSSKPGGQFQPRGLEPGCIQLGFSVTGSVNSGQ